MKHLKKFEHSFYKFSLNDLVVFQKNAINTLRNKDFSQVFKIVYIDIYDYDYPYKIMCFNEKDYFWCREENIRLATPEEIEQYEFIINANKYNL